MYLPAQAEELPELKHSTIGRAVPWKRLVDLVQTVTTADSDSEPRGSGEVHVGKKQTEATGERIVVLVGVSRQHRRAETERVTTIDIVLEDRARGACSKRHVAGCGGP